MKKIKDNFSSQADDYAAYRPRYPEELYRFILSLTPDFNSALDVATGNGQVAVELAKYFDTVAAIDISEKQLAKSIAIENINYSVSRAELLNFDSHSFELITVGQAAHWFDLEKFYAEAKRVLKPGGVLALFGYTLPVIDPAVDAAILKLYEEILGPYWDSERKIVDSGYKDLWFPFGKISHPEFKIELEWNYMQLIGFLGTWSAVQHYKNKNSTDPLRIVKEEIRSVWGNLDEKKITFPVFLLVTKIT